MSENKRAFVGHDVRDESEQLLYRREREKKKDGRKTASCCAVCVVFTCLVLAAIVGVVVGLYVVANRLPDDPHERAIALLDDYPLIDGYIEVVL